jgi:hypothetical protein
MSASHTGGAPGPNTYSWSLIAPITGAFLNPTNASSQIVQFTGVPEGVTRSQTVRVQVNDSQGNSSTQDATASVTHNGID